MKRWAALLGGFLLFADSVQADTRDRTAVLAIELASGIPEPLRQKTKEQVVAGLTAAGYEVAADAKLSGELAQCRQGPCLAKVGEALKVSSLVVATFTRKHESTVILIKLYDSASGELLTEAREVCDLCGQTELEERTSIAASALRSQAAAVRTKRATAAGAVAPPTTVAQVPTGGKVRVAIIPGVAVNLDAARVDALSQDMADALQTELEIEAVGGLEVRRQLPPDGLPPDCVANPTCTADVAKRLDASQLLFVVMIEGANSSVQVDSTWVDPAAKKSVSRPAIEIPVLSEAKGRFATAAKQLLPDAPVRPKPKSGGGLDGRMTEAVPRHMTTTSYVTAGVAVVGLGVGIGFGLRAKSLYGDCDKTPNPCTGSDEDKIRSTALIADIGYVVAIGGAVATAILYATSGSESKLVVGPAESGSGVTLTAVGRF